MIYCTFNALLGMSMGDDKYTFITKDKNYEDILKLEKKQGAVNNCYKDGIGSIENTVKIICDYGLYKFKFTEFTVDIDIDIDLPEITCSKESLQKNLKQGNVIICTSDELHDITSHTLYILDCIKEEVSYKKSFNLDENIYNEISLNTSEIKEKLEKKEFAIIPLVKKDDMLVYKDINIGLNQTYTFYKRVCPKLYYTIDSLLEKNVEILADFVNYKYCIMNINKTNDIYKNEILEVNLLKELDIYEIMDLDNTGTTHLSIVSNYSNLDIDKITESLKKVCVNNKNIEPKLLFNYVKKSKIKDIGWIEDYIIKSKYFFGYDILLKFLKTCKKIINFDKIYNYVLENAHMQYVISAIKENKNANFAEIEDLIIKRFKKDESCLSDFILAFPEQKFNKIKEKLTELGLAEKSCYHLIKILNSNAWNKIDLIDEFKELGKDNKEFLESLIYYTQDFICESKQEPTFVDKVMNLMFELDVNGESCHVIYNSNYSGFNSYESDISKYWNRICDLENVYKHYQRSLK